MKYLIINLTRMGDIIQTLTLSNGIKRKHPDAEVHYLVTSSFKKILEYFPSVDKIIDIDDSVLVSQDSDSYLEGYSVIESCVRKLNREKYDVLINPVVSIQSSLLGYLIKADVKRGMFFNKNREQSISSDWTAFHLANEHHLGDRTLNLVDIFAEVGKIDSTQEDYKFSSTPKMQKCHEIILKCSQKYKIGFHIGASRSNKTWEVDKFKRVIESLLGHEENHVFLFGGYSELELKEYFSDLHSDRFTNYIGDSTLEELIGYVSGLDAFVCNDIGPMHIAAAAGIPVVNISLGPVSLWETGPYTNKGTMIQADISCHPCSFSTICDHLSCHKMITEQDVLLALDNIFSGEPLQNNNRVMFWKSRKDIFGFQHSVPHYRREIRKKELFFEFKRVIWLMTLVKNLDVKVHWGQKYTEYLQKSYDISKYGFNNEIHEIEKLLDLLSEVVKNIKLLSAQKAADKKSVDRIQNIWMQLKELKSELFQAGREFSEVFDFFYFAQFQESNIKDSSFRRQVLDMLVIYDNLSLQLKTLSQYLRRFNENIY